MKRSLLTILFMLVTVPAALYAAAPDTVWVPNDYNQGTINDVINAVQNDTLSNGVPKDTTAVFMLYRGGYYVLNGTLTLKRGTHYAIEGEPAPSSGLDSGMAIIIPGLVSGGYYNYIIDCFGDLSAKNVWFIYGYTSSGTQDWMTLQFEQNDNAQAVGDFDNCIFDYVRAMAVTSNRSGFVGKFNRTTFRNCIDPSQWWAGRMFATVSQTITTDSIGAENCTFENMGFAFQTDYIPPVRTWFNHNTFLNIVKFPFKFYYMTHLVCTNNVFVNCHFSGERYNDRIEQDPDNLLYGAVLDVDTMDTRDGLAGTLYNGVPENQRVVIFYNNSNYTDPAFQTFYTTYDDTVSALRGQILAEPMMNARTLDMFTWHPFMKMANVYDATDPSFVTPATNMDSIMAFLFQKYVPSAQGGGGNIMWGYQTDSTLLGIWPTHENLAYTNSTLLTAGMGGFPLGDLFHWFPTQYTSWAAQQSAEDSHIYQIATGVKTLPGSAPAKFALDQNYPNPFNPSTIINYTVPQRETVTLKVFNVLGQEVATVFNGIQNPGNYQATFNGSKFASGVYFYRLQAGSTSLTKKMILTK
ncbi:MAG TPA: T9SS type A sorting domain-containing protein [Candidatus Kryptonia bacterium]